MHRKKPCLGLVVKFSWWTSPRAGLDDWNGKEISGQGKEGPGPREKRGRMHDGCCPDRARPAPSTSDQMRLHGTRRSSVFELAAAGPGWGNDRMDTNCRLVPLCSWVGCGVWLRGPQKRQNWPPARKRPAKNSWPPMMQTSPASGPKCCARPKNCSGERSRPASRPRSTPLRPSARVQRGPSGASCLNHGHKPTFRTRFGLVALRRTCAWCRRYKKWRFEANVAPGLAEKPRFFAGGAGADSAVGQQTGGE